MLKRKLLFLVLLLCIARGVFAQNGTLDNTFGNGGIVLPNFGEYLSDLKDIVVQPDGKIISAGGIFNQSGYNKFALVRFNTDGSLDHTFGTNGKVINDFGAYYFDGMLLQPDGKIIIGTRKYEENSSTTTSFLVRYTSEGSVDIAFGTNGVIFKASVTINALALQPDGKIIVVESSYGGPDIGWNSGLLKYNPDGSPDATFGNNGFMPLALSGKMLLQPDGKILISGGYTGYMEPADFTLRRYLNNGTVDTTFGTDGISIIDVDVLDNLRAATIQNDGKIVFIGSSHYFVNPPYTVVNLRYELIRLLPNGILDTDFGVNGISKVEISAGGVTVQPDGKIIVAGGTLPIPDGPNEIALSRFVANGTLDGVFGNSGIANASLGESIRGSAVSVKMSPNGEIVVGGAYCEAYNSCHPQAFVMRFNSGLLSNTESGSNKKRFIAYPNPVNSFVNLDFNLSQSEELSVDLYDNNGSRILNLLRNKKFQTGQNSQKLDLPEILSKGIYFLNISNDTNTSIIKIVK